MHMEPWKKKKFEQAKDKTQWKAYQNTVMVETIFIDQLKYNTGQAGKDAD